MTLIRSSTSRQWRRRYVKDEGKKRFAISTGGGKARLLWLGHMRGPYTGSRLVLGREKTVSYMVALGSHAFERSVVIRYATRSHESYGVRSVVGPPFRIPASICGGYHIWPFRR